MKKHREIPKFPIIPYLNKNAIESLTNLCFRKNLITNTDALFVFGANQGIMELVHRILSLLDMKIYKNIIISGGCPRYNDSIELKKSEAEIICSLIKEKHSCINLSFFLEKHSTNTLENVLNSREFFKHLSISSMTFVSKSYVAGRCYLTLSKYCPHIKLSQSTYHMPAVSTRKLITPENWSTFEEGKQRVWGEYLRMIHYSKNKSFSIDPLKKEIKAVESSLANQSGAPFNSL